MSALYEAKATRWWNGLTETERKDWLDRAAADGRERSMLAAYTLRGDAEDLAGVRDEIDCDEGR